jgi:hypothetical protein
LQTTLRNLSWESEPGKGQQGRFILCIAPEAKVHDAQIPEPLIRRLESIISEEEGSNKRRLQDLLGDLEKEHKQGQVTSANLVNRVEDLLGKDGVAYICSDQLGDSDLRYFYDLTLGSRPDAVILDRSKKLVVLLENKIHGGITDVQIRRHIRENFGEGLWPKYATDDGQMVVTSKREIPVCARTWRDIYSFFSSLHREVGSSDSPDASYLVGQFLEYLEVIGMGEIRFDREDFLEWESYKDIDYVRNLLDRVQGLGETLARYLGEHWVNRQNISRNYLGVNIVHNKYEGKGIQPVNVPHWSLAIQQHGAEDRCLRLYIQCESKRLGRVLLKNRSKLQDELASALQNITRQPSIVLRVEEKSHLIQGGKGKNEGVWNTYFSFPLELCSSRQSVKQTIAQAFEAMDLLHNPHTQKERMNNWVNMPSLKGKSIVGVLQLNYQLNWLALEKLGIGISTKLQQVVDMFKPYYDVLLEAVQQSC